MEMLNRFFDTPSGSFFLFGARGTGKSTLLKRLLPEALYLDLLDPELARSFAAVPERLRDLVAARPAPACVVVDEVQRAPGLLPVVHALIEERKGHRFVLTGSSARKLKRTGADLLAGRAVLRTMHPFMAAELGDRFELARALEEGTLPIVLGADGGAAEVLRTYAALYLKEEVQAEGLVRSIGGFARFLESISFSHAGILTLTNVARECAVQRKTVEGYVDILEDLLLAWRLPAFTKRARRGTTAHPKFYLFDTGVFRSLRARGPLDRPEEIAGQALEGLVAQHLRAWAELNPTKPELFYWRTRAGLEVDFVVYGPDGIRAVEVKNAARVDDADLRALRAFREDYPEATACLAHRGTERLVRFGVLCLPVEEFLRALRPSGPWPGSLP